MFLSIIWYYLPFPRLVYCFFLCPLDSLDGIDKSTFSSCHKQKCIRMKIFYYYFCVCDVFLLLLLLLLLGLQSEMVLGFVRQSIVQALNILLSRCFISNFSSLDDNQCFSCVFRISIHLFTVVLCGCKSVFLNEITSDIVETPLLDE